MVNRDNPDAEDFDPRDWFADEPDDAPRVVVERARTDGEDPLSWFADEPDALTAPVRDERPSNVADEALRAAPPSSALMRLEPQAGATISARSAPWWPGRRGTLPAAKWSRASLVLVLGMGLILTLWLMQPQGPLPNAADRSAAQEATRVPTSRPLERPAVPTPASPARETAPTQTARRQDGAREITAAPANRPMARNADHSRLGSRAPGLAAAPVASTPSSDRPPLVADSGSPTPGLAVPVTDSPAPAAALSPAGVAATPPAEAAAALEHVAVRRTLDGYLAAYGGLDVAATAQVWPTVDRPALTRAFGTLKSQDVSFQACDLDVAPASAVARCLGVVQFVRKVGSSTPRVASQHWTFTMHKVGAEWKIDQVVAAPAGASAQRVSVVDTPSRRH